MCAGALGRRTRPHHAIGGRVPDSVDVIAMTWCYPTHTGNEVSSYVGDVVQQP